MKKTKYWVSCYLPCKTEHILQCNDLIISAVGVRFDSAGYDGFYRDYAWSDLSKAEAKRIKQSLENLPDCFEIKTSINQSV